AAKPSRRRVLVDTDPVFTQLRLHGVEDPASYDRRFTYGENVGLPGCTMPDDGLAWAPTRQPVMLDLWPVSTGDRDRPLTTVTNWSAYGEHEVDGIVYGQKSREFARFEDMPTKARMPLEIALG